MSRSLTDQQEFGFIAEAQPAPEAKCPVCRRKARFRGTAGMEDKFVCSELTCRQEFRVLDHRRPRRAGA